MAVRVQIVSIASLLEDFMAKFLKRSAFPSAAAAAAAAAASGKINGSGSNSSVGADDGDDSLVGGGRYSVSTH